MHDLVHSASFPNVKRPAVERVGRRDVHRGRARAQVLDRLSRPGCEHYETLRVTYWLQWHLHRQLRDASAYAAAHRVALKGDLPIGAPAHAAHQGGVREQQSQCGRLGGVPVRSELALPTVHGPCRRARAAMLRLPGQARARGWQAWTRRAWTRGSTRTCSTWTSRPARRRTTLTPTARTGASPRTTGRRWPRTATPGGARACPSWPSARPPGPAPTRSPARAWSPWPTGDRATAFKRSGGFRALQRAAALSSRGALRAGRLPACESRGEGAAQSELARARARRYFHAYRIDHILGFFRIWEIPGDCATGLLGHFRPSHALTRAELEAQGIWDFDRCAAAPGPAGMPVCPGLRLCSRAASGRPHARACFQPL